jgi:hypothetical protein
MWNEAVMASFDILFWHFLGSTEESHEKKLG